MEPPAVRPTALSLGLREPQIGGVAPPAHSVAAPLQLRGWAAHVDLLLLPSRGPALHLSVVRKGGLSERSKKHGEGGGAPSLLSLLGTPDPRQELLCQGGGEHAPEAQLARLPIQARSPSLRAVDILHVDPQRRSWCLRWH